MTPRSHRSAVPGKNPGYGATPVSDEFYGDPEQMPDWAKPAPDEVPEPPEPTREPSPPTPERSTVKGTSEPDTPAKPASVAELREAMQEIMLNPVSTKSSPKKRSKQRERRTDTKSTEPEELTDDQWREKARAILLRQLTASDKSAKQLKDKLLAKECPEVIADEVIERFVEVDLVDDEKFAQAWVRARTRTRGLARGALKHELRSKGIADEIAQLALEQVDDQDEEERARELVRVKLRPQSMGVDRDKALRRLVGMLGRKGYNGSLAFRVAREEWDARFGES